VVTKRRRGVASRGRHDGKKRDARPQRRERAEKKRGHLHLNTSKDFGGGTFRRNVVPKGDVRERTYLLPIDLQAEGFPGDAGKGMRGESCLCHRHRKRAIVKGGTRDNEGLRKGSTSQGWRIDSPLGGVLPGGGGGE